MPSSNSSGASSNTVEAAHYDLLWALRSPVLCGALPPLFDQWSKEEISDELPGEETASLRRVPIGRYFERLIHEWLSTRSDIRKLATNLPLRREGTTLGEVDLLFEAEGRCFHWELALKFYLGTGDRLETRNWYGPGGRDRLDLKLDKLESHQLRLLQRQEGQEQLKERGLAAAESHTLIKGYLFHPFLEWAAGRRLAPACVNREHAHGWWIHLSDLASLGGRGRRWKCLEKREWLAPARGHAAMDTEELEGWLHNHFDSDDRPPMIVAISEEGHEVERGFVVPDTWAPAPR